MAFESREGTAPPPPSVVMENGGFFEIVNGSSVRQELEEGPLKGLKASGGQHG